MNVYEKLLRPFLFSLPAETAHHLTLGILSRFPALARMHAAKSEPSAATSAFGVNFPVPVGLAAGMDKNGVALPAWEELGFGFAEIGTITAHAQPGNPKPRLFRYPRHEALINRMGFNNDGAEAVAARLGRLKQSGRWPRIPIGINLGKSKVTPLEEAHADYARSFKLLRPFGDYFVINVSSPNTPGLRDLQATAALREIIRAIQAEEGGREIPLLVKIAPDLEDADVLDIVAVAEEEGLAGIIATNTTLDHSAVPPEANQQGGLSGKPLAARSTEILRLARTRTSLPLIGSGGIMNAEDAGEKFKSGASLVQIYTGFVYRGPALIEEIARIAPKTPNPS